MAHYDPVQIVAHPTMCPGTWLSTEFESRLTKYPQNITSVCAILHSGTKTINSETIVKETVLTELFIKALKHPIVAV